MPLPAGEGAGCVALQALGVLEAAPRVEDHDALAGVDPAFGAEARCARASPDVAALAFYRAGQLYLSAKKRAEARDAFQAAADVQGASTPDAKRRIADARRQAKQLGAAAGRRRPTR